MIGGKGGRGRFVEAILLLMDEGVMNIEGKGEKSGGEKEEPDVENAGDDFSKTEGADPFVEPTEAAGKPENEENGEGGDGGDDAEFGAVSFIGL